MKLTVLVDNNTYIDRYFHGEPALSFFIEDNGTQLLFDTGYSDCFITNAQKLEIDLSKIEKIVLSHGHNDHTGGLAYLANLFDEEKPAIVAHPDTFLAKQAEEGDIGASRLKQELSENYLFSLVKEPVQLTEKLLFLGEIPQLVSFEPRKQVGKTKKNGSFVPDFVLDDSALVYQGIDGLYIITGCSHSGICNICEYAKQVAGIDKIITVIGGFHLFEEDDQLVQTVDYFKKQKLEKLYPSHCVSFKAKAFIHHQIPIEEVGVGLVLDWQ